MEGITLNLFLFIALVLSIDVYVFCGIRKLSAKWPFIGKRRFFITWWSVSILILSSLLIAVYFKIHVDARLVIILLFFILLLFKASFALFLLVDDLRRIIIFTGRKLKKTGVKPSPVTKPTGDAIPRSEFLLKAGLLAGAVPIAAFKLNMKSGLYDYQVKRHDLYLPNLPKAFDGMKLAQISDIHSGSFFNKRAVLGGVETLLREKADLIFFTGDLVNEQTKEMRDYQDIFSKVKAPLGVFSSLGNHDYGDYRLWPTPAAKQKNLDDLVQTHKNLGWDLLRNENRRLKIGNEEIGILGLENWGELSRFPFSKIRKNGAHCKKHR
jgi:uncharacterized protein